MREVEQREVQALVLRVLLVPPQADVQVPRERQAQRRRAAAVLQVHVAPPPLRLRLRRLHRQGAGHAVARAPRRGGRVVPRALPVRRRRARGDGRGPPRRAGARRDGGDGARAERRAGARGERRDGEALARGLDEREEDAHAVGARDEAPRVELQRADVRRREAPPDDVVLHEAKRGAGRGERALGLGDEAGDLRHRGGEGGRARRDLEDGTVLG